MELKTDVAVLLESIRYHKDDVSTLKQALLTLAAMCTAHGKAKGPETTLNPFTWTLMTASQQGGNLILYLDSVHPTSCWHFSVKPQATPLMFPQRKHTHGW